VHCIGIDIGKHRHVAAVCRSGERVAERRVLRFGADRAGLEQLLAWIAREGEVSRVVMESSGHYWMALAGALDRAGLPVAVVNPVSAKHFAKRRLQRTKSDPADARTLAALGMADEPRTFDPLASVDIRQAARFVMRLVEDQSRVLNRIQRLVDLGFPELGQVYDDPTCVSALAVLRVAPTALVAARKHVDTLAKAARPGGGRPIGRAKADEIIALAKRTIAPPELEHQVRFEMLMLIEQHDLLERQIDGAESRVQVLLDGELARRLQTIPGVGPATAATLIAEIGDIHRFSDLDQLVAYAGVHPAEKSSGQKGADPETSWEMAKTGNAYLRAALFRMAVVGITHNPVIREHYARKRAEGKTKMNALGHCMKKALALVWGIWRGGHDFTAEPPPRLTSGYGT
jgi:transposase